MLYLTSKEYDRSIIEGVFIVGFVCLWIFLGSTILILIQRSRSEDQVEILKLEKEVEKHKKEVEELKKRK